MSGSAAARAGRYSDGGRGEAPRTGPENLAQTLRPGRFPRQIRADLFVAAADLLLAWDNFEFLRDENR